MADRYVKIGGSNILDGTSLANAWETAIYGFANVGQSNTLKFSAVGGSTFFVDRSSVVTPIANGVSGNHTIITDNGDGAITLKRTGTYAGIIYFNEVGTAHKFITFQGTATNQLIFDLERLYEHSCAYLGNTSQGNGDFSFINCEIKNALASGVLAGQSARPIFRGCHVHDNGNDSSQEHGLYLGGNLDGLVENCVFYDNSANGLRHGGSGSGGNLIVRNNISYRNGFPDGTNGSGIIVYDSNNAQIYNNVCYENAIAGIHVGRGTGVTVYHNSCHGNKYGILLGGFNNPTNTTIKNNILLGNDTADLNISTLATGTTYAWNRCSSAGIVDNGASSTDGGNNVTTGVDTTEWVAPNEVDLSTRDYKLKAGAASIAPTGIVSVGIATDLEGTSRNFIDQGAYAYGSTTPPNPPIIAHPGSEVVTHEFTDVSLTLTKGTNNIVECTVSGTGGKSAISATPTNVTVVRN